METFEVERSGVGPYAWLRTPLLLAAMLGLVELLSWRFELWLDVGQVPLSPSAVAGVFAVAWLSRFGRFDRSALPIVVFTAAAAVLAAAYTSVWTSVGLLLSAAGEEAVYRIAVPVVAYAAARVVCRRPPVPFLAATAAAAAVFTLLPGHAAQFSASPMGPLPWVGLTVLWVWMLWRGAPVVVVAAHHMGLNCVSFAVAGGAPFTLWAVAVTFPVIGWVVLESLRDRALTRLPTSAATLAGVS